MWPPGEAWKRLGELNGTSDRSAHSASILRLRPRGLGRSVIGLALRRKVLRVGLGLGVGETSPREGEKHCLTSPRVGDGELEWPKSPVWMCSGSPRDLGRRS